MSWVTQRSERRVATLNPELSPLEMHIKQHSASSAAELQDLTGGAGSGGVLNFLHK